MSNFSPRVAIITGGGSGIGAAMARELALRGSYVIVADLNLDNAIAVSREIGVNSEALRVDVSDGTEIETLVNDVKHRCGELDCLVNCAGITSYGEAVHIPGSEWTKVISVNLMGTVNASLAAYAIMSQQGYGTIINIASMTVFLIDPFFVPYITSKFGVFGFSRALAIEAEARGVHVSVVCPGNIHSALSGKRYTPSRFMTMLQAPEAVLRILHGVAKRRRIIVFPLQTKIFWLLDRISPSLLNPIRREILQRGKRRIAQQRSGS